MIQLNFNSFISLVLLVAAILTDTESLVHDDLIVAVGDHLEFFTNGTSHQQMTLDSFNASRLSALAYDGSERKLFFSDRRHDHGHIFKVRLGIEGSKNSKVEDIVERNEDSTVWSLAYDSVDQVLLWTDSLNRSIRRIQINQLPNSNTPFEDAGSTSELIHFADKDDKPRGLVCDSCTRTLYWTNGNMRNPTIERSNLNGTDRQVLVQTNLLPQALDLDVLDQRLYWADNIRNGYFLIERSYVNGKGRQLLYRGIGQFVVSLAVGRHYVYWSDYDQKKVWFIRKDGSMDEPQLLRQYHDEPPMALVIYNSQPLNCSLVSKQDELVTDMPAPFDPSGLCQGFCFNNGRCSITNSTLQCSCLPGFSGDQCRVSSGEWTALIQADASRNRLALYVGLSISCLVVMVFAILFAVRMRTGGDTCQRIKLMFVSRQIVEEHCPAERYTNDHLSIVMNERVRQRDHDERPWTNSNDGWATDNDNEYLINSE